MKKNNTAEKAVLEAEKISKALKESTEKSLRDLINETISNVIANDDEDTAENSLDVDEVETDETPEVSDVDTEEGGEEGSDDAAEAETEPEGEEDAAEEGEEGDDADEWSDMEQYKIGDDDYDFTGVDGDELLKVYNKLGDDDQIFVKKEDDGTYSVKDDETGAEFVIELNSDKLDAEGDEEADDELSIELSDDEPAEDDDEEIEIDLGDEDDDELNEDLGYTDSYQKDVFDKKFNMSEPADSKTTIDADVVPKGSEKPWAGKGDGKPFEENLEECDALKPDVKLEEGEVEEAATTVSQQPTRKETISRHEQIRPEDPAQVKKVDRKLEESVKKIVAKAKAIQAENKQYKESLEKIKKSLYEAAVLNVNLGKLVDLFVNEAITRDEKKSILNRFNNVKTISEGKVLYDTIKIELNESRKASTPTVDKQFAANTLNESVIYSNQNDPSIDLMNRMDNLYKKNK